MTTHLSPDEISRLLIGDAGELQEEHVAACAGCRSEVRRLRESLHAFRDSVHEWSAAGGASVPHLTVPAATLPPARRRGVRWAFAFAVLLAAALPLSQLAPRPHPAAAPDDVLLLQKVDAHLSRPVAAPLEQWMELISVDKTDSVGDPR